MKSSKIIVLFATILASTFLSKLTAQVDLTINPLYFAFKGISGGADVMVAPNFSIEGTVGQLKWQDDDFSWTNFQVTAFGKYYINTKNDAAKFYADVFSRYVTRDKYDLNELNAKVYSDKKIGVGLGGGFKLVSNKGFVFDIGLGAGRAVYNTGEKRYVSWPNFMLIGTLGVGYRFGGR